MSKARRFPKAQDDKEVVIIDETGRYLQGLKNPPQFINANPGAQLDDPSGITTPQGWVMALKRYINELHNQDYTRRTHPKPGDWVVEVSTVANTATAQITHRNITVGQMIKFVPMTQENSELADQGYVIRLLNGEVESWGNSLFLTLSVELLFIYRNFIYGGR